MQDAQAYLTPEEDDELAGTSPWLDLRAGNGFASPLSGSTLGDSIEDAILDVVPSRMLVEGDDEEKLCMYDESLECAEAMDSL